MKVYLAARYSRHPELQAYARDLQAHSFEVTARWLWGGHDLRAAQMGYPSSDAEALQVYWAQEDWDDLMAADVAVFFTEGPGAVQGRGRGGRHVELGAALAAGKRVCVVGFRENVFCWLPQVEWYATWPECLARVFADQVAPRPTGELSVVAELPDAAIARAAEQSAYPS